VSLGFGRIFLTGGEPFLLPDIFDIIRYGTDRCPTTVLTNGLLLRGRRLEHLASIAGPSLTVQVSLDGARPEHNDGYRGRGSWSGAVGAIRALRNAGVHVAVSSTETPDNARHLAELRSFVHDLGVPQRDHFVRPMARRGFATEGMEVGRHNLEPEITVSADGVYWHPLLAPSQTDTRVSSEIIPLAEAAQLIAAELRSGTGDALDSREEFT
jgi:MoaA/NifB/PqqE/SkfB family radical SAM enzyme